MNTSVALSQAVVDHLNAGTFSIPFVASRAYSRTVNAALLTSLVVSVIPGKLEVRPRDLSGATREDWEIYVYVQRRANPVPEECDPVMNVAEEIADMFPFGRMAGVDARVVGVDLQPVYDLELLEKESIFSSRVVIIFRIT